MTNHVVSTVFDSDLVGRASVNELLSREGIRPDANLDYRCAIFDDQGTVIATGSLFGNTIRCLAVRDDRQGEGLLNEVLSHLIQIQYARGNTHLFVYTKVGSAPFFRDLGFYEITRVHDRLVFLENQRQGFDRYLEQLEASSPTGVAAAVIVNANPFTLGHQFLIEKAAAENELVQLFVVREDASLVPFEVRQRLVREGTAHLTNLVYHDTGSYLISNATFPSYFLKDERQVIESQAELDVAVFCRIAKAMNITRRYVGEEPTSQVTGIYNEVMNTELGKAGIEFVVVPRRQMAGSAISASKVREIIQNGRLEQLRGLVPETTYRFFTSADAEPIIKRIRAAGEVAHY